MSTHRSTHRGTCQACGSIQKLPSNVLSTHGYSVECSMFTGICCGSGWRPFEVATDLIERTIHDTGIKRDALQVLHGTLIQRPTGKRGRLLIYRDHASPMWIEVLFRLRYLGDNPPTANCVTAISVVEYLEPGRCIWVRVPFSTPARNVDGVPAGDDILADWIATANHRYADVIKKQIDDMAHYIQWQRQRVDKWKPAPLLPLSPGDK